MSARLSLRIDATLEEVARLQAEVAAFGKTQGWPGELEYQVELAIEELCVNVVSHGGQGEHGIELALESSPDSLTIEIMDNGIPFDPFTQAPAPDLDSAVEERPVGGLGVFFVKTLMDEAHYRHEGDRNHVTLVKRRSS